MKTFHFAKKIMGTALFLLLTGCASMNGAASESQTEIDKKESTPTNEQRADQIVEHKMESRWLVRRGFFKENFERIAHEIGIDLVVWDERTENCEWRQSTEFVIPRNTPHEALAFYAATQDFHLVFSNIDNSVRARYEGPRSRLSYCN